MSEPRRILFVIPSLGSGGAERVMLSLIRGLDRSRYRPELVVFHDTNAYPQDTPTDLRIHLIHKKHAWDFPKLILSLASLIRRERPALVVSFLTYANFVAAAASKLVGVRAILTEHNHFSAHRHIIRFPMIKTWMVRLFYRWADRIVFVSNGVKADFCRTCRVLDTRCLTIYNPIDVQGIRQRLHESVDHPWLKTDIPAIVACGRLADAKNYPLLLRSMAEVNRVRPCRLLILGEGPKKEPLIQLGHELGLAERVEFLGFQPNPFKFMAAADAYVMSSSWEGLPTVLIEAMACGVPVISTDCPSGPSEIIEPQVSGLLVPVDDVSSLSAAIIRVLGDVGLRQKLIEGGRRRVEIFSVEQIVAEYQALFEDVCG